MLTVLLKKEHVSMCGEIEIQSELSEKKQILVMWLPL